MTQQFRRRRSAQSAPAAPEVPAFPVDEDGDRRYTEEDYAIPDEWEAEGGYLPEEDPAKFADMPLDGDFVPEEDLLPEEYAPEWDEPVPGADEWGYAPADDPFAYAAGMVDDEDADLDELLTDEEREELSRSRWSLLAGLMDFAGVIVGTAVILVLVMLLVSLINWLMSDISQTFTLMQMRF